MSLARRRPARSAAASSTSMPAMSSAGASTAGTEAWGEVVAAVFTGSTVWSPCPR